MRQETDYVRHHIQKVIGFFAAMREFAKSLKNEGHKVVYYKINDSNNTQSLHGNIIQLIREYGVEKFEYQLPDEYRLDQELKSLCDELKISSEAIDSEHFYTSRSELSEFFAGKKQFLMESFYRYMRKKHQILMADNQPEGGKWNFDQSNRKKWTGSPGVPPALVFNNDVAEVLTDLEEAKIETIGRWQGGNFPYPINQKQAREQLQYFCDHLLKYFGDFQDALHNQEEFLFHSRLSFAMNLKILNPQVVVNTVLNHYRGAYKRDPYFTG